MLASFVDDPREYLVFLWVFSIFFFLLSCAAQETPATSFTLYLITKVEEAVAETFGPSDRFLIDSQSWNHLAIFELPSVV